MKCSSQAYGYWQEQSGRGVMVLKCQHPKIQKNSTENAQVLTVFQIDVLFPLSTVSKSLTSASAINVFHPVGRDKVSATDAHDATKSV